MPDVNIRDCARALDNALRTSAQRWSNAALFFKLAVFILGTVSVSLSLLPEVSAVVVLVLTGLSGFCRLKSNDIRGKWESLHRALDASDSFGWPLSIAELSDLLLESPRKLRQTLSAEDTVKYFGSARPTGAVRAVENMQESAWWSKHLAKRTATIYLSATCALTTTCIVMALLSIETAKNYDLLSNIGRIATALLMLIFSLDLINLSFDYSKFSQRAHAVEERAESLLSAGQIEIVQAIKLMNEYHLARAAAPMVPDFVYGQMRNDLNELWDNYRARKRAKRTT
jgi:hypothetical protein